MYNTKNGRNMKHFFIVAAAFSLFGCSSLVLQPADFSWPVESILKSDASGMVAENRFAVAFSITALVAHERGESQSPAGLTVRVIRDREGYYYITAPQFKSVYVFTAVDGTMKQSRKIEIGETEMTDPKFNQRDTFIELVNGQTKLSLTKDGIMEGGNQ